MAKITYTDKDKDGSAPVNQWRDLDANEVKTSVNAAYDELARIDTTDYLELPDAEEFNSDVLIFVRAT